MQADPFDPFAYAKSVKENPDDYVRLSDIWGQAVALRKIRHAPTAKALHVSFQEPAKTALAADDTVMLDMLKAAAKKRRKELEPA
jgi:hypothetical protein